jgi:hypothetical protein
MITLPYRFMLTGIVFALIGMGLGIHMGTSEDFTLAPVHAHINLVGWASMMLFGLFYRGAPQSASTIAARVHYWVALVGAACLAIGIYGTLAQPGIAMLVIPGSLLTILSMATFLWVVWQAARKGI